MSCTSCVRFRRVAALANIAWAQDSASAGARLLEEFVRVAAGIACTQALKEAGIRGQVTHSTHVCLVSAVISALPTERLTEDRVKSLTEDHGSCAICMEPFKPGEVVKVCLRAYTSHLCMRMTP